MTTIFSLPEPLIEKILQNVSANSFKDLFNSKKVCKSFWEISTADSIYKAIDLSKFRGYMKITTKAEERFLDTCYEKGNPKAIYNKGVRDYFVGNETTKGLHDLKRAADGKYYRAIYVYAMLQRTLGEDDESKTYIKRLMSNCIRNIRYQIMTESDCAFEELFPAAFIERREAFDSNENVVGCYCKDLKDSWPRRVNQLKAFGWDDEPMCDECFWHIEHIIFLKHFPKHISFWV